MALVLGLEDDFAHAHPRTAELVIEICVSSHEYDRSKLRACATAGVRECWLVLGPERRIEVHRQPAGEQHTESTTHGPGGQVASAAVPNLMVDLSSLFAA